MRKLVTFIFLILPISLYADVRLPSIISDNMVLQQRSNVAIWGWAKPGEKVTVKGSWQFFGVSTKANACGKWKVRIHTTKAGGPYKLVIKGDNVIVVDNILFGEVWLASGQSNMEMPLRGTPPACPLLNAQEEVAAANHPDIRLFQVERKNLDSPQEDCGGCWKQCSPDTAAGFSAAAYFFGREIHKELNIPVGLIDSSWGATLAEAWTPEDVFDNNPEFNCVIEWFDRARADYLKAYGKWQTDLNEWEKQVEIAQAKGEPAPQKPVEPPLGPGARTKPIGLFNAMINPLIPFHIKGVIWYQGEGNSGDGKRYGHLFPSMIQSWRQHWAIGDFSFYYVQISPYNYGVSIESARLRDAQRKTLSLKNTGMAVTLDIGNFDNIHPANKQDVGKRLALWALAKDYGCHNLVYSGPLYKSIMIEGGEVRLSFDHIGSGLLAKDGILTDFLIAGSDKKFISAKAKIEGDYVVVWSDKMKDPVAVRYGWSNRVEPTFFNKDGLPASSFRTDDWEDAEINKLNR